MVDVVHPAAASTLVGTGIFRVSRNPMELGLALLLGAWATHLSAP